MANGRIVPTKVSGVTVTLNDYIAVNCNAFRETNSFDAFEGDVGEQNDRNGKLCHNRRTKIFDIVNDVVHKGRSINMQT